MYSHLDHLSDAVNPLPKRESSVDGSIYIYPVDKFSSLLDTFETLECFLNLPDEKDLSFALDLQCIATGQQNDQALWQHCITNPINCSEQQFSNTRLPTYRPLLNAQWKSCIPTEQLHVLVNWHHQALSHYGLHTAYGKLLACICITPIFELSLKA
jgi:hypothetical protein